jgi:hypothetical protein
LPLVLLAVFELHADSANSAPAAKKAICEGANLMLNVSFFSLLGRPQR